MTESPNQVSFHRKHSKIVYIPYLAINLNWHWHLREYEYVSALYIATFNQQYYSEIDIFLTKCEITWWLEKGMVSLQFFHHGHSCRLMLFVTLTTNVIALIFTSVCQDHIPYGELCFQYNVMQYGAIQSNMSINAISVDQNWSLFYIMNEEW